MGQELDRQRTIRAKLERLRRRLNEVQRPATDDVAKLISVIKALIDVLEDEL